MCAKKNDGLIYGQSDLGAVCADIVPSTNKHPQPTVVHLRLQRILNSANKATPRTFRREKKYKTPKKSSDKPNGRRGANKKIVYE
jgi:hypothetical protein